MSLLKELMKGTTQEKAFEFFDSLPPADEDFMKGLWEGYELPSGHPMDGLLSMVPWYGKCFSDPENVHPLVMKDKKGFLFFADPDPLLKFADLASCVRCRPENIDPHIFDGFLKLFSTRRSRARLREIKYRGVTTAAMVYDHLQIIDVFRKVNKNTVVGVMDFKGRMHDKGYFFVLRRRK